MVFCDFQINSIKSANVIHETKSLLLSDSPGIIDITDLHESQDFLDLKTSMKMKLY